MVVAAAAVTLLAAASCRSNGAAASASASRSAQSAGKSAVEVEIVMDDWIFDRHVTSAAERTTMGDSALGQESRPAVAPAPDTAAPKARVRRVTVRAGALAGGQTADSARSDLSAPTSLTQGGAQSQWLRPLMLIAAAIAVIILIFNHIRNNNK